MEHLKISELLNNPSVSKFVTKIAYKADNILSTRI